MTCAVLCLTSLLFGTVAWGPVATPAQAAGTTTARTTTVRYRELITGTLGSTSPDVTTSAGRVSGTPIVRGTATGEEAAEPAPPPCSSGASTAAGSSTLVATDGAVLYTSFTGSVCVSRSSASSSSYRFTGTFSIEGGTRRFAGATGGGTTRTTFMLRPTALGSQGPYRSRSVGTITLTR